MKIEHQRQAVREAHPEPLLRLTDLSVSYGRGPSAVRAVSGVSLEVPVGSTMAIIGESGCGKSTVAKAICGLIPVESGSIHFDGAELTGVRDTAANAGRRGIQTVQQDPSAGLDPRWPIWRSVAESRNRHRESRKVRRDRAVQALEEVSIGAHLVDRLPAELSGGQRQRVTIARALAAEAKLIILDEAVSALDVSVRNEVLALLQRLKERHGLTYVFITHDVSVVTQCATDVAVFYLGQVVEKGSVEDVLLGRHHPYTQALLSAVPTLRGGVDARVRMEGDLPSAAKPPAGCRFHTRCPFSTPLCVEKAPALEAREPGHATACHRVEELLPLR